MIQWGNVCLLLPTEKKILCWTLLPSFCGIGFHTYVKLALRIEGIEDVCNLFSIKNLLRKEILQLDLWHQINLFFCAFRPTACKFLSRFTACGFNDSFVKKFVLCFCSSSILLQGYLAILPCQTYPNYQIWKKLK